MGPFTLKMPRLALLLGLSVVLSLFTSAARAADAEAGDAVQQRSFHQKISERLFNSMKKLATKIAARLTAMEHCDVAILNMERDDRNRMYIDLEGECDLQFPVMPRKLRGWMEDLPGHHMRSDGPMNFDYTVTVVEQTGDKSYHVEFRAKIIIVLEEVLSKLVTFGANVIGTVTLMGIGNDLAAMIEGIDGVRVGESLGAGLKDMSRVLMGLAGVEAYDAYRGFRADRESIGQGHSPTTSVLMHLAGALVKGALNVTTSIVGMSVGAAVGTALFPGIGSTLGAIVGAAGFTLVGNIVYRKLTVDLPVAWRLGRIRRMAERMQNGNESDDFKAFLASKIEKQELKLVKRFSLELRTDKFRFFDELVEAFKGMSSERRAYYTSLRRKIEQKLQFEVVNRGDKLFAWKLDQMRAAFGDPPFASAGQ